MKNNNWEDSLKGEYDSLRLPRGKFVNADSKVTAIPRSLNAGMLCACVACVLTVVSIVVFLPALHGGIDTPAGGETQTTNPEKDDTVSNETQTHTSGNESGADDPNAGFYDGTCIVLKNGDAIEIPFAMICESADDGKGNAYMADGYGCLYFFQNNAAVTPPIIEELNDIAEYPSSFFNVTDSEGNVLESDVQSEELASYAAQFDNGIYYAYFTKAVNIDYENGYKSGSYDYIFGFYGGVSAET